jgi:hypothetical protein
LVVLYDTQTGGVKKRSGYAHKALEDQSLPPQLLRSLGDRFATARSAATSLVKVAAKTKNVARSFGDATAEFRAQCEPQYHLRAFSIPPSTLRVC